MTKEKRVFLYVTGDDYSAMEFNEDYDKQLFYEDMVKEGVEKKIIDNGILYAEVYIYEFGSIDENFLYFVKNTIQDEDQSKQSDFFEVSASK